MDEQIDDMTTTSSKDATQQSVSVIEKDGVVYLRRGKPITTEEVAELLADFP